jgi:ElaA protein
MNLKALELSRYTFSQLSTLQLFQILKLRTDIFVVEQHCAYPEIDAHDLSCLHVCMYQKNELIAYCRLIELEQAKKIKQTVKIGRVLVAGSARGQGIGHILLDKVLSYVCESRRYDKVVLSGQSHLIEFYRHHGFDVISDHYLDDGIEHVDMQRML